MSAPRFETSPKVQGTADSAHVVEVADSLAEGGQTIDSGDARGFVSLLDREVVAQPPGVNDFPILLGDVARKKEKIPGSVVRLHLPISGPVVGGGAEIGKFDAHRR